MTFPHHSKESKQAAITSTKTKRFAKPAALALTFIISGWAGITSWAQSNSNLQVYTAYYKQLKKFEAKVALEKPNFRLIMREESFEERFNAVNPVTIKTKPEGAISTLYDFNTGEPLETCKTPCDLHIDNSSLYFAVALKPGHNPYPMIFSGKNEDNTRPEVWLGINYFDMIQKARTCYKDFQDAPKVDGDVSPCLRVPPVMPPWAEESGHCKVIFDVTAKGRIKNAKTTSCTHDYYKQPSLQSMTWWAYTPKVERGVAVNQIGVPSKISFKLSDENGNLIPEPTQ